MAFAANGEIMPRTGTAKRTHTMETDTTGREIVPGPLGATESRDKGSLNGRCPGLKDSKPGRKMSWGCEFVRAIMPKNVCPASPLKDELRFSPFPEDMINGTVVQS